MAEYYRNPFVNGRPDKRRTPMWLVISDILMWTVTIIAITVLLIIFAGRFISPERMWYFSLLGLAAPVVYIIVILELLYWIIRWKWAPAALTALFAVIGLFHVSLYYKLDVTKHYGEPNYDKNCIKVLTFNIRSFRNDQWATTADSVATLVRNLNPDIICFQEYLTSNDVKQEFLKQISGYHSSSSLTDKDSPTVVCFSKYRTGASRRIEDWEGSGICICTDIYMNDDTVRVYNAHLQTTSVTAADKSYISNAEFIADSTRDQRFIHIAQSLRRNNAIRARQAEAIRRDIAECPYPVIVCGDFNDVPISYTYRTISKGLEDPFRHHGHSYAHTFRGFFDALRIDYIFSSPDFESVSYEIVQTGDISDHYPVMVRLKQTSKQ